MKKVIKQTQITVVSTDRIDPETKKPEVLEVYFTPRKPKLSNLAKKAVEKHGTMKLDIEIEEISETREMDMETFIKHSRLVEEVKES